MRHFYLIVLVAVSVTSLSQAMENKPKKRKGTVVSSMLKLAGLGADGKEALKELQPFVNLGLSILEKKVAQMDEKFELEKKKVEYDYTIQLEKAKVEAQKADSEAKRAQSQIEFMQLMFTQLQRDSEEKNKIIKRLFTQEDTK